MLDSMSMSPELLMMFKRLDQLAHETGPKVVSDEPGIDYSRQVLLTALEFRSII